MFASASSGECLHVWQPFKAGQNAWYAGPIFKAVFLNDDAKVC